MIASTPFPTAVQMVVVARRMSTSTTMKSPVVRTSWNSPGEKQTSTDLFSRNAVVLSCRQDTAPHLSWETTLADWSGIGLRARRRRSPYSNRYLLLPRPSAQKELVARPIASTSESRHWRSAHAGGRQGTSDVFAKRAGAIRLRNQPLCSRNVVDVTTVVDLTRQL